MNDYVQARDPCLTLLNFRRRQARLTAKLATAVLGLAFHNAPAVTCNKSVTTMFRNAVFIEGPRFKTQDHNYDHAF